MVILTKKGMAAGVLVTIILTIIAFMLIAGVITRFTSQADDKQAELLCHDSIALRAQTQIKVDGTWAKSEVKPIPVLCKTLDKKITGTREEIKEQIADKVARCWWMFGEGRYEELLSSGSVDIAPQFFGMSNSPNKCFTCFSILVGKIEGDKTPISYAEMLDYMLKNHPPKLKSDINYIKYIQNYGGPGLFGMITKEGIKEDQGYAISILPKNKDKDAINWVKWGGIGVATVGFVGTVVCTAATFGACAAVALPILSTATVVGAKTAAVGVGYEVVQGKYASTPDVSGSTTQNIPLEKLFEERMLSSIYVSDLDTAGHFCPSSDIAGN